MPVLTQLPPWALMWLLAMALFALAKTAALATAPLPNIPLRQKLAFLLLFPGMNAAAFFTPTQNPRLPALPYLRNILLGALLLWLVARLAPTPLLQGWLGMTGLILLLHFGTLQLLSLAWQRRL